MNYKERMNQALKGDGKHVAIWHDELNSISESQFKRLLDASDDSGDLRMKLGGEYKAVEIAHVDDEVDFMVITMAEYNSRYGVFGSL